jgi:hypothetical protein
MGLIIYNFELFIIGATDPTSSSS